MSLKSFNSHNENRYHYYSCLADELNEPARENLKSDLWSPRLSNHTLPKEALKVKGHLLSVPVPSSHSPMVDSKWWRRRGVYMLFTVRPLPGLRCRAPFSASGSSGR